MAKIPDDTALGPRPAPQPSYGLSSYQGEDKRLEAPGLALGEFGREILREFQVYQEKADTTRVEDAWNQYKQAALEETHGEKGILKLRGGDAVNGNILQRSEKNLAEVRDRILQGLANDDQRRRFKERAGTTDLQVRGQALMHLEAEHREYDKSVMMGSEAAARTQIRAMPQSQEVFAQARDTLLRQADAFLTNQGITDAAARQAYKDKITDGLWTTRIDELLYSQPVLADALLRANEKEIKNPELRLSLQHKTREVALSVSAAAEAQAVVDEYRGRVAPSPASGNVFDTVVGSLLKREGGYVAKDGKSGAPANFGINQKANPDIEVKTLTRDQAVEIYRTRYWNAIGGDRLAPATALVALDAAALQGVDVAKKLLAETQGDPQLMITRRRAQLQELAAKDPEHAKSLAGWMARMDSLQSQVMNMPEGGMQAASMTTPGGGTRDPFTQNTSGMPLARDIAAQLPFMLLAVEKRADGIYGPDKGNPDRQAFVRRMTTELNAKVAADVQQLTAIQRQAQGLLIDAVTGTGGAGGGVGAPAGDVALTGGGRAGTPGTVITSFSQIQQNPTLLAAWQRMDPQAKLGIERLIEFNQRQQGAGNEDLYWKTWKRIHLPTGTPGKIDFYQQIIDLAGPGGLDTKQIGQLRLEIDRAETPGGRSVNQMRAAAAQRVEQYFKTHMMFTAQPARQIAATARWAEDVGRKVDEYVKAGTPEKVRAMFQLDTPESVLGPVGKNGTLQYLESYVNSTPAAGQAQQAQQVRNGTQAPLADAPSAPPPAEQPANVTTRAQLDAWLQAQPAHVTTFKGLDGQVRLIPGRAAPAGPGAAQTGATAPVAPVMNQKGELVTPPPAADQGEFRADGSRKGDGFLGPLKTPDGRVSTEISIGVELNGREVQIPTLVPTLTGAEINSLLNGDAPSKAIVDKAVAHAKQRMAVGKSPFAQPGESPVKKPDPDAEPTIDEMTIVVPEGSVAAQLKGAKARREAKREAARKGNYDENTFLGAVGGQIAEKLGTVADYLPIVLAARQLGQAPLLPSMDSEYRPAAVIKAFEAIKRSRQVTPADAEVISEAIESNRLSVADKKFAKALLKKIEGGK